MDLEDMRAVSYEEGAKQGDDLNTISFIETSALSGTNVVDAFEQLARSMIASPDRKTST